MIQTFKRTTVCVTKQGLVYACGDKFAKNIKLSAKNPLPYGFYALPVDFSGKKPKATVDDKNEKCKPADKKDGNKKPSDVEDEPSIGDLFGDDDGIVVEDGDKKAEIQLEEV